VPDSNNSNNSNAKLSVEDRLDIMELFAKYAWAIDMGDIDGVLACFAEDGYLDHLWQGKLQGPAKIRAAFEELWYDRPSWWMARQHLANHFLITKEGEGARVKAFFSILQYNIEYRTNFVFGIGTWDNFCVKRNAQWVFKSVYINAWTDAKQVPWKGEPRAYFAGAKLQTAAK
jgi:SnoaL-like domain